MTTSSSSSSWWNTSWICSSSCVLRSRSSLKGRRIGRGGLKKDKDKDKEKKKKKKTTEQTKNAMIVIPSPRSAIYLSMDLMPDDVRCSSDIAARRCSIISMTSLLSSPQSPCRWGECGMTTVRMLNGCSAPRTERTGLGFFFKKKKKEK